MAHRTAGQAIVDALVANGVDTLFGLPGAQIYALFDALHEAKDKIRTIGARHEQGLGYMAFGYARSTGRLGVYAAVPGPGVLNTTAAMCTALGACAPTLCLTAEIPSAFMGKGRHHLHELPDQLGILKRLTKWAAHINAPAEAPALVNQAIGEACSGRQGPAALSICWDRLGQSAEIGAIAPAKIPAPPAPDPRQVDEAVRRIKAARRPMIFVGSGAQHASAEVRDLAELLGAPVVGFRGGRGIVGEDHPLGLSMAAAWQLWPETDLMLGIGSRMELPFMRWGSMMEYRRRSADRVLVRIDIDPAEMDRLDTHAPMVADAAAGAQALAGALRKAGYCAQADSGAIADAKRKTERLIREIQPQMDYVDAIRDVLPRDGFFVEEISQVGFTASFGFPVYHPRTYVSCGHQGTLGFGFPTALGVKLANPDKQVVSVTGDGGFMFAVQELATAVQYGIAVVTVIFDNGCFGNVRRDQQTLYDNHLIGSDLVNPDFVALAESFGVKAFRVTSPAAMRPALEQAFALGAPAVIHCMVPRGSEISPWRFLQPGD